MLDLEPVVRVPQFDLRSELDSLDQAKRAGRLVLTTEDHQFSNQLWVIRNPAKSPTGYELVQPMHIVDHPEKTTVGITFPVSHLIKVIFNRNVKALSLDGSGIEVSGHDIEATLYKSQMRSGILPDIEQAFQIARHQYMSWEEMRTRETPRLLVS